MKKLLSVILCLFSILTIFCTCFISSSANSELKPATMVIFQIKINENITIPEQLTYDVVIQNLETKEKHKFSITGTDSNQLKTEIPLSQGKYEIKKISTKNKNYSVSLEKTYGEGFEIKSDSKVIVPLYVKHNLPMMSFSDFMKNNFVFLIIIIASTVGLVAVKRKNEK